MLIRTEANPRTMTDKELVAELTAVLAAGVRRELARQSSSLSANNPESSLDFSRPKSGRALRRVRHR